MSIRSTFSKLTGIAALLVLLALTAVNGTGVQAGMQAQATSALTMDVTSVATTTAGVTECRASIEAATLPANTSDNATTAATSDTSQISATQDATLQATEQTGTSVQLPEVYTRPGCIMAGTLAGDAEVPAAGAKDGSGYAAIAVNAALGQVCFDIYVKGIALPATATHIYRGEDGAVGTQVLTLTPPDKSGHVAGCINSADKALLAEMVGNPDGFYVNVDNAEFVQGAVRGSLGPATRMLSSKEVPPVTGAGSGYGTAQFDGDSSAGRFCWFMRVFPPDIEGPQIWIYKGKAGEVGVQLFHLSYIDYQTQTSADCTDVDKTLVADMIANPGDYYVNILNNNFPKGVMRGQLAEVTVK